MQFTLIRDMTDDHAHTLNPFDWTHHQCSQKLWGGDVIEPILDKKESILEEAEELTNGERQKTYGNPKDNFGNIATAWKWWLNAKYGCDVTIEPEDVAMMMTLLKVAREANLQKRDNIVDGAGYFNTYSMCLED